MSSYVEDSGVKATILMRADEEKNLLVTKMTERKKYDGSKVDVSVTATEHSSNNECKLTTKKMQSDIIVDASLKKPCFFENVAEASPSIIIRDYEGIAEISILVRRTVDRHNEVVKMTSKENAIPRITNCDGVTVENDETLAVAQTAGTLNEVVKMTQNKNAIPRITITNCDGMTVEYEETLAVTKTAYILNEVVKMTQNEESIPRITITNCDGMTVEYDETLAVAQTTDRLNEVVEMTQKKNALPRITITNCDGMTVEYDETLAVAQTSDRLNEVVEMTQNEKLIPRITIKNCDGMTVEYDETFEVAQTALTLNEEAEMTQKENAIPRITITNCDGMTVEYDDTLAVAQTADRLNEVVEMTQDENAIPRKTITNCDGMTVEYEETLAVVQTADRHNEVAEMTPKEKSIPRMTITNCDGITGKFLGKTAVTKSSIGLIDQSKNSIVKHCNPLNIEGSKFEIPSTWTNEHQGCSIKTEDKFNTILNDYLSRIPSKIVETSAVTSEVMAVVLSRNIIEGCPSQKVLKDGDSSDSGISKSLVRRDSSWKSATNCFTSRHIFRNAHQTIDAYSKQPINKNKSKSWKKIFKRKQRNELVQGDRKDIIIIQSEDEVHMKEITNFILKKCSNKKNRKRLSNGVNNHADIIDYLNTKEEELKLQLQQRWRLFGKSKIQDQLKYITKSKTYLNELREKNTSCMNFI